MKLITETNFETKSQIVESTGGEKEYFIEGIFMQADIQNRNGRIYPREILNGQINEYNETFIKRNRAMGELGHPENPSLNLERVSHNIVSLQFDGDHNIIGRAKLIDTPYGKIAKTFVREGIELGVSSRGVGSVMSKNGKNIVQENFRLSTVDIVADPSAPQAFVSGIMEGKEWVLVDGALVERDIERLRDDIEHNTKKHGAIFAEKQFFNSLDQILRNARKI